MFEATRRTLSITLAASTLGVLAANSAARAYEIALPPPAFDKQAFHAAVEDGFDGEVMGYAAVLLKNGLVVDEVAGGKARNAKDGNVDMTTSIPAYIGSSVKFTTGVALLQLFESKNRFINPSGKTRDQWLDSFVWPYLPTVWQNAMHPSIKQLKFRHLLQHRSGFPPALAADELGENGKGQMFDYLRLGVAPDAIGKRNYANANVMLLSYLIPMINQPTLRNTVNLEFAKNKNTAEDVAVHKRIADEFEAYMHDIYAEMNPSILPSCNPTAEYPFQGRIWAPDYTSATDTAKGGTRDSRNNNGYCQGQGGWYFSAREIAAYVAHFATNRFVSAQTRDAMFDDDDASNRLVWSFTYADSDIQGKYKLSSLPYVGGDHFGAHATIVALPNGYYAVGIINSDDMNSNGVTGVLVEAFKAGAGL